MAEAVTAPGIGLSRYRSDGTETSGEREFGLLLLCLRATITEPDDAALRRSLLLPIDWTCFARKVTEHNVATPVAQILLKVAPDLLPDDLHYACQTISDEARTASLVLSEPPKADLSPEDEFLNLANDGRSGSRFNLGWLYATAKIAASHPSLNWDIAVKRARAQGCLRILMLALLLANECFGLTVPHAVAQRGRDVASLRRIIRYVLTHWQTEHAADALFGLPLKDQLRLHDNYSTRLYFGFSALTESKSSPSFALRRMGAQTKSLRAAIATSAVGLAFLPRSPEEKSQIRRYRLAVKNAHESLTRNPERAAAWRNLGHALSGLGRYRGALRAYDKALTFEPEHPAVWQNRSAAIEALGASEEAYPGRPRAGTVESWLIQAGRHYRAQRFTEASVACDRVLGLDPKNVAAKRLGIHCRLHSCDWNRRDEDICAVTAGLRAGDFIIRTLDHRTLSDSEEENRLAARLVAEEFRKVEKPLGQGARYRHDKIRVAYLSTDFHTHAVASLIAGCFEHHDRSRFDTVAVSLQPGDGSELRKRLEAAFDRFIHAQTLSDATLAQLLRRFEIDIAVDLNGYTGRIRTGVLARRPAPVQVSYLGFPGTMDAPFIDYILADRFVIPKESSGHYREKIAYLPFTYMPADNKRRIADTAPTGTEAGLPERGFVFACLSYARKISPDIFDIWMRLLSSIEGSVLWLRSTDSEAAGNLRREAAVRGVSPDRLIFAPPVPSEADYLARLRLADLFLDTLPYNAHATACDALWAGLPLLTCAGHSFHSRVAGSLLYASALPELVTTSLAEYEDVAQSLANDPARLAALKARLVRNRDTSPLFDTARMTRDLEAAYTAMWERSQSGQPPESFTVASSEAAALRAVR